MSGSQIVKNSSRAFSYNYASLADIVNQGFKIPIMETRQMGEGLFMGWIDEKGEWRQGAPVVVPEMKGMNAAQAMGSALTYARRYTAQMALGLACDDDAKLEKTKGGPEATGRVYGNKVDFTKIRERISEITDADELIKYWMGLKLSEKQASVLKPDFAKRRAELGGKNEAN